MKKRDTPAYVTDTAYNSAGTLLATAQSDATLTLWRPTPSWSAEATFSTPHTAPCTLRLCFAPPQLAPDLLATVGTDGLAVVHALHDGGASAQQTALRDAASALHGLAFSRHGVLATVGKEAVVRLYTAAGDSARWGLVCAVDVEGERGLAFSPCGKYCVGGGAVLGRRGEWEWEVVSRIGESVRCADWGAAGFIAVGRKEGVEVWGFGGGGARCVARMEEEAEVEEVEWDRGGGVLAAVVGEVVKTYARETEGGGWVIRDVIKPES